MVPRLLPMAADVAVHVPVGVVHVVAAAQVGVELDVHLGLAKQGNGGGGKFCIKPGCQERTRSLGTVCHSCKKVMAKEMAKSLAATSAHTQGVAATSTQVPTAVPEGFISTDLGGNVTLATSFGNYSRCWFKPLQQTPAAG